MFRHWLLTSTFYANWLPGDQRGFVGRVWDRRPDDAPDHARVEHNVPGTPCDDDMPGLERASAELMRGPPIRIERSHAELLLPQFRETAAIRHWPLLAVAIMTDHVHLVARAPAPVHPTKVLGDFKGYGSRPLTARFGKPPSETWWTSKGSKRFLPDEKAIAAAVYYVLHKQYNPLLTWHPGQESAP